MQIHQPISHGLLYSVAPQDLAQMHLSDQAKREGFEWEEYGAEYAEDTLANNIIAFLNEMTGK